MKEPVHTPDPRTLSGLHLLLTYECNYECDHCFVWGGPSQTGTMTMETVERILDEAQSLGTVEWIYFEGGEPFLYYDILVAGVRLAHVSGFRVGIVSNAYWAKSEAEAMERLKPLAGLVDDLSISSDAYHGKEEGATGPDIARGAARALGIPVDFISVAEPDATGVAGSAGKLPPGESAVLFRGRAADRLASRVAVTPWERFDRCPWEALRAPERVHVDPFGNLHVCQGISIGNLLQRPLASIMRDYDADEHPIVGPLLAGGPAEIVRRYGVPHDDGYADHCHLCYAVRRQLRGRFPAVLAPDQMYTIRGQ
ncbi:MAG TPA: radical SAM protein [Woeseiaceae bacterium]|nr:radical SAM protein [Woeseiaceae bacterium]